MDEVKENSPEEEEEEKKKNEEVERWNEKTRKKWR
jgi:hypothetical protein